MNDDAWMPGRWRRLEEEGGSPCISPLSSPGCSAGDTARRRWRNGNALSVIRSSARARAAESVRAHAALPPSALFLCRNFHARCCEARHKSSKRRLPDARSLARQQLMQTQRGNRAIHPQTDSDSRNPRPVIPSRARARAAKTLNPKR